MKKLSKFSVGNYLSLSESLHKNSFFDENRYKDVLDIVMQELNKNWENSDEILKAQRLMQEKGAIIGIEQDVKVFKDSIREILVKENLLSEAFPPYYPNLIDGIFSDLYGLCGIAPWAYNWEKKYENSSSLKLIGERLYCMLDGKTVLLPQRIPKKRRDQLLHALLLSSPKERKEDSFHEVYLQNGIRVTIYSGECCKEDQDITVFRKYILKKPSFEDLAKLNTFPKEAIPLFKAMGKIGYNVVFAGPVRSGKTTFLQAWQAMESPELEGVAIATDPETPWDKICPNAPLMQLIADEKALGHIEKSLKRSDADYVILEEMRDAPSYNLFLAITNLGTMRSKGTIHDASAVNVPYKMATAIATEIGGNEEALIAQLFSNIHFIFEFSSVSQNRAQKRLLGISSLNYDAKEDKVFLEKLCKWDEDLKTWLWASSLGKREEMAKSFPEEYSILKESLKKLSQNSELKEEKLYPAYYNGNVTKH